MNLPPAVMNRLYRDASTGHGGERRSGSAENPNVDLDSADFGDDGSLSATGARVGQRSAMRLSPWFRAVALIANTVGRTSAHVYRDVDGVPVKDKKHPAAALIRRNRGGDMTAFIFKQVVTANAISKGNGYAYILRDKIDGKPLEWWPLNSSSGTTYPVREDGRLWYVTTIGGKQRKLDPMNVLHIKGFSFDGLVGVDLISAARDSIGLGLAAEKFASNFYRNQAKPGCWIETPKRLTRDAAEKLANSWDRMHSGLDNSHKTAVFEEGAKIHPFTFDMQQSELGEARKWNIIDVANFIGCPVHKLGGEGRTGYASLEQENQSFVDECMDPWFCNWEQETTRQLMSEEEKDAESAWVEFNRGSLVRANMVDRFNAHRVALGGAPFGLRNEIRLLENLPPIPGGDVMLDPVNMTSMGGTDAVVVTTKEKKSRRRRHRRNSSAGVTGQAARPVDVVTVERSVAKRLVVDCLGRMARRLATQARRAATDPRGFTAWIEADKLAADHRATIVEAIEPSVTAAAGDVKRAERTADALLSSFRSAMVEVTDVATREALASSVDERLKRYETEWPAAAAEKILKGEEF